MSATLLDEALEGWRYAREGVIAELENIPAESFGFRPTPETKSVAELARHIIESSMMMAGELSNPKGDFTRQPYPAFLEEYAGGLDAGDDKDTLLAIARRTLHEGMAAIRDAGEALMMQPILQFNGEPARRLSWMSHGVAHEEYHRGQLALYARLLGRVPALTQLIQGS